MYAHRETAMWGHSGRTTTSKAQREASGETKLADTLILDFQPPELWEMSFYCLSPSGCGILLWQPEQTNTPPNSFAAFTPFPRTDSPFTLKGNAQKWFLEAFQQASKGRRQHGKWSGPRVRSLPSLLVGYVPELLSEWNHLRLLLDTKIVFFCLCTKILRLNRISCLKSF